MAQSVKDNNPWNRKSTIKSNEHFETPIVSFDEIMAEQFQEVRSCKLFLKVFQEELDYAEFEDFEKIDMEESKMEEDCSRDYQLALELSKDPDYSADHYLAQKLQREYDRETELQKKFVESKNSGGLATGIFK